MTGRSDPADSTSPGRLVVWFALVYPLVFTYIYFIQAADAATWLRQTIYVVGKTIQFGLPAAWLLVMARRWPKLVGPGRWELLVGASWSLAVVGLLWGLMDLLPTVWFTVPAALMRTKIADFGIDTPGKYFALSAFYAVFHSLLEEYYWRWFAFGGLRRLVPLGVAIAVSSVAFMAHHLVVLGHYFGWSSPLTFVMAGGIIVGGAFWAWLYHHSGSLWGAWLSHAIIDIGVFAIGYKIIMPGGA